MVAASESPVRDRKESWDKRPGGEGRVLATKPAEIAERRLHRRLAIRLPVEYTVDRDGRPQTSRAVTHNISTGGLYFEADLLDGVPHYLPVDIPLEIELTIPPGDGHFPYEGRVRSVAEVIRCDTLRSNGNGRPVRQRLGVAARFRDPLRLAF